MKKKNLTVFFLYLDKCKYLITVYPGVEDGPALAVGVPAPVAVVGDGVEVEAAAAHLGGLGCERTSPWPYSG